MQYVRKQEKVDAIQLVGKTTIEIDEGEGEMIEGEVGDWLVRTSDGESFILNDEEFKSKYEPMRQQKQQGQRAVTPDALFNLYEETARAQPIQQGYQQIPQQYPQQAPYAAQGALYPPQPQQPLPPMIPIGQPQQQPQQREKRAQPPKKKGGLGGLFGGRKKKSSKAPEKDDFTSSNVQIV